MRERLDDIRLRIEKFLQEVERENYLARAALKTELNSSAIYDRFPDLGSQALVEFLRARVEQVQASSEKGESLRKLKLLLMSAVDISLNHQIKDLRDQLWAIESRGMITLEEGNTTIPFSVSELAMMEESDRTRRGLIADARAQFILRELNPIHEEISRRVWEQIRRLGYKDYVEMEEGLQGFDLLGLHTQTEEILARTEDVYLELLTWFAKKKVGVSIQELRSHDLAFLARGGEFDRGFPAREVSANVFGFLQRMNLDPSAHGALQVDLDPRPGKTPGAFCFAVRVPEEVYVVINPRGGADDYQAFLHQLGHALHLSYTSPSLDWEYKRFGDRSTSEGFAATFDHLVLDKIWLKKVLGLDQSEEYRRHRYWTELLELRRTCAMLSYELLLHRDADLIGKADVYSQILRSAMKVRHPREYYLADVPLAISSPFVIRGRMIESILSQYLTENFDEDWFLNPRTGEFFKDLWHSGQKLTAEELARHLAYPSLTLEFLVDKIESALR